MINRKLTVILGVVIFIGAIFLFRFLASGPAEDAQAFTNGTTAIGVPVIEVNPSSIISEIPFTGRVIPEDEIQLFAEVSGNLISGKKAFKTGTSFKKGEVLIHIDDREQKQAVMNQKSQFQSLITQILADINIDYPDEYEMWSAYLSEIDLESELEALPTSENKKFNLFLIGRGVNANFFAIKQSEVRLSKYTIEAPYSGVVTESLLDPGTLVRVNQKLGQFTKTSSYEIEASINSQDRFFIDTGDNVLITIEGNRPQTLNAKVERINSRIDATTQTLLIYLQVKDGDVLAGQYVSGSIAGQVFDDAQKIANKSLVRSNMVFIANDSIAVIKPVTVLASIKDSLIIKGLSVGDLVIDEFRDPSFEGTKVAPLKNLR